MTTSTLKTIGVFYLRRALAICKRNAKNKYVTIPIEKAEEIIEQASQMNPQGTYDHRQNSVRAAALVLCVEPTELIERMNGKTPKEYMAEIAELKNKIKLLVEAGDAVAENNNVKHVREWVRAKNF